MGASWPDRLGTGDRVRFDGQVCTVTGVCGGRVALRDVLGATDHIDVVALLAAEDFAFLGGGGTPSPDPSVPERALWWRQHVTEVLTGVPYGAPPGTKPRPGYDPTRHTLAEREDAKARELAVLGVGGAAARTVRRKRQRYQQRGLAGLTDGRAGRHAATDGPGLHPRVQAVVQEVVAAQPPDRPLPAGQLHERVLARLAVPIAAGELPRPSRAVVRRLAAQLLVHTGKERTGSVVAVGERVHLETVELPLPFGQEGPGRRLRLLVALDEATRLVLTAVVHAGPRPSLHATLLARMCAPTELWADWGALLSGNARPPNRRHAPPLVVRPAALVIDDVNAPGLRALREACANLGIHVRSARHLRPVDRVGVERTLQRFTSLFSEHLLSAAGQSAREAGWPPEMVQDLLEVWVARVWPDMPVSTAPIGGAHTPRTRHETLTATAGWTPVPIPPQYLTPFLKTAQRVVGSSGIRLGGRLYDAPDLKRLRQTTPPSTGRRPLEVRWDPYDLRNVWLRSGDAEWITARVMPPAEPPSLHLTLGNRPLDHTSRYADADQAGPEPSVGNQPAPTHAPADRPSLHDWRRFKNWMNSVSQLPTLADPTRALPEEVRLTYHARLPLRAPGVTAAARQIEDARTINRHTSGARYGVLLTGQAGTGKTTALWESARRCTAQEPDEETVPVVYTRLAPATSPRLLLAELGRRLGLPLRGSLTTADLVVQVSKAMETARTRLILVDEIQHLRSPGGAGTSVVEVLDYLCDRIPATFAFAGIGAPDALAGEVTRSPYRRLAPVHLSDLPPDEDWVRMISETEAALRLHAHEPGTLTAQAGFLHERTGGNVGRLAFLLRTAAVRAIREGTEQLTASLLSELPLPGQSGEAECGQPIWTA
ncbi:AAA family ATPase [Streptomyces seoulensis]|nr:AAA family ATPase [Streptomyces seoulensis]